MEKAEKGRFDEAIKTHKKMGIQTYTLVTDCGKECLIKQPSIIQTGKIMPLMVEMGGSKADFNAAATTLIRECWIAGDDEIRKSEELLIETGLAALNLVEMKIAKIKKN